MPGSTYTDANGYALNDDGGQRVSCARGVSAAVQGVTRKVITDKQGRAVVEVREFRTHCTRFFLASEVKVQRGRFATEGAKLDKMVMANLENDPRMKPRPLRRGSVRSKQ
jgi:hypothetical protein